MKRHAGLTLIIILFFLLSASCSLKYNQGKNVQDVIPEFSFSGTTMTRYEDSKKNLELKVGNLEQYKDGFSVYAKDVQFSLYDENNRDKTAETSDSAGARVQGTCGYLSANTKTEVYEMFDHIKLNNMKDNMAVSGRSFHWNGKSEQLTAGKNDTVVIEKDGMTVYGSGFSASGVSSSYSFGSVVTGNILTDKETVNDE